MRKVDAIRRLWRAAPLVHSLSLSALAVCACLALSGLLGPAWANQAAPASADPALEARVMVLSQELRCLVCQNQTIADSNADLAVDLRGQVRDMLRQGKPEAEILDYMTARYGDFVLYRPPLKSTTAVLWFGPALLLVVGVASLWFILRRRSRLAAADFEPDVEDDTGDAAPHPPKAP